MFPLSKGRTRPHLRAHRLLNEESLFHFVSDHSRSLSNKQFGVFFLSQPCLLRKQSSASGPPGFSPPASERTLPLSLSEAAHRGEPARVQPRVRGGRKRKRGGAPSASSSVSHAPLISAGDSFAQFRFSEEKEWDMDSFAAGQVNLYPLPESESIPDWERRRIPLKKLLNQSSQR